MRMLPVYGLVLVTLIGCAGLQYEENSTGLTVIGWKGDPMPESIVIPASVRGIPVTEIKKEAFYKCSEITSVTIPDSVKGIGKSAFYGCSGLTSVTIPGSVKMIGDWAFRECGGLISVSIPDGVTEIGEYAFFYCPELTSVTIPGSVTKMGSNVFRDCKKLTSVTILDGAIEIGWNAFMGCTGLTLVTLPDSVTKIDDRAFYGCTRLTSVTIPGNVTEIGDDAFKGCSGLTSVSIPDGVTKIGDGAFSYCRGLSSVTIPDGVTEIGRNAFFGCNGLTSVTIPDSVTEIGQNAFKSCSGLTSVTISDNVTTIGDCAFEGCYKLTLVTIPDGVTEIGRNSFRGCTGLTSVTIPGSVTKIGQNAFKSCSGLTSVTIPDGVTEIGDGAFSYCTELTSVTIPSSIKKLCGWGDSWVFYGCTGLTTVVINVYNTSNIKNIQSAFQHPACSAKMVQLVLRDGFKTIEDFAFEGCSNVTSITIPDGVTEIGESAFDGCTGLTSITLPKSVTKIGPSAFAECSGLTSIVIPDSVTEIGESAFAGCTRLTSVTLTDNVIMIGERIFPRGENITVNLKSQDSWRVQTLLNTLNKQEVGPIYVTLADGVERIDDGAFANQEKIVSVELPESVKHLGKNAFVGCTDLQTITLRFAGEPPVNTFPYFWKLCKWEVPSAHQAAWKAAIAQGRFNGVAITTVDPSGAESVLSVAKAPEKGRMVLITGTLESNLRFAVAMGDIEEAKRFAEEVAELDAIAPQEGKPQQLTLLEECLVLGQTEVAEILYKRGAAGVDIAKAEFWKSIPSESVLLDVVEWLGAEDREVLRNGEKAHFSPNLAFVTFLRLNKLSFAETVRSHYGLSCQDLRIEDFGFDDNRLTAQQAVDLVDYLVSHGTPLDDSTEDYSVLVALLEDQDKEISETKRAVLLYLIERGANVNATIKTRLVSKREERRIENLARDIAQAPFLLDDLLERAGASEEALREAELAYEKFQKKLEQLPLAMSMFYGDSIYSNPFYAGAMDSAVDKIVAKETKEIVLKALEQSGHLDYDTVETPVLFSMIARKEGALANAMLEHGATLPCVKRDPKNGDVNAIDEALRVGNRELAQRLRQLERQRARNR